MQQFLSPSASETLQSSAEADEHTLLPTCFKSSSSTGEPATDSDAVMEDKSRYGFPSATGKRSSPVPATQPKPNRPSFALHPAVGPLQKKMRAEAGRASPGLRVNIPTILVEDQPMEEEGVAEDRSRQREGDAAQPRSPEEGRTLGVRLVLLKPKVRTLSPPKYFNTERKTNGPLLNTIVVDDTSLGSSLVSLQPLKTKASAKSGVFLALDACVVSAGWI